MAWLALFSSVDAFLTFILWSLGPRVDHFFQFQRNGDNAFHFKEYKTTLGGYSEKWETIIPNNVQCAVLSILPKETIMEILANVQCVIGGQ